MGTATLCPPLITPRASLHRVVLCVASLGILATLPHSVPAQSLVPTTELSFGSFVAGNGGTVLVATNGSWSKTGSVVLMAQAGGASAAQFIITGGSNAGYSISLPANNTVTLTGPSASVLPISQFMASLTPISPSSTELRVGASLVVGAQQAPGRYTGSYSITVEYQ